MSERSKRPLRRRIQTRVMGVLNIPLRVLLRLPFATPLSGRLMLAAIAAALVLILLRQVQKA